MHSINSSATNQAFALWRMPSAKDWCWLLAEEQALTATPQQGFAVHPFVATDLEPGVIIPGHAEVFREPHQIIEILGAAPLHLATQLPDTTAYSTYKSMFHECAQALENDPAKKVVLSRITAIGAPELPNIAQAYMALCAHYPGAFVFLVSSPTHGVWMGATPETLVQATATGYQTMALAGTRPSDSGRNFGNKEIHEQELVTQFLIDRLTAAGITAQSGTAEPFSIGHLEHLRTLVQIESAKFTAVQLAYLLHPTPAVCGLPQKWAQNLIAQVEHHQRGLYCGFMGPLQAHSQHLFVTLRTLQFGQQGAAIYTGGGITAYSNCEAEWEETRQKSEAILRVFQGRSV